MDVTHKDWEGNELSPQQVLAADEYFRCYYLEGTLEKEEFVYEGQVVSVFIYNNMHENHLSLISNHSLVNRGLNIIDIEFFAGNYKLHTSFHYDANGHLQSKWLDLFDSQGYVIGQEKQSPDGLPDYSKTQKFYWDKAWNPNAPTFESIFNKITGNFEYFNFANIPGDHVNQAHYELYNTPSDLQLIMKEHNLSKELIDYYLNPVVRPAF